MAEKYETIGLRVRRDLKEKVKDYANRHDWALSKAVRNILIDYFKEKKNEKLYNG